MKIMLNFQGSWWLGRGISRDCDFVKLPWVELCFVWNFQGFK